jgi:RHS repeat-associated protein
LATANTYRFSSREYVPSSGLYVYLYRFYNPGTERWLNQDPLAEAGGINLYGFVGNRPVYRIDPRGLFGDDPEGLPSQNGSQVNAPVTVTCTISLGSGSPPTINNNDSPEELALMMTAGAAAIVIGGAATGVDEAVSLAGAAAWTDAAGNVITFGEAVSTVTIPIFYASESAASAYEATAIFYAQNPEMIPQTLMIIQQVIGMSSGIPPSSNDPLITLLWVNGQLDK